MSARRKKPDREEGRRFFCALYLDETEEAMLEEVEPGLRTEWEVATRKRVPRPEVVRRLIIRAHRDRRRKEAPDGPDSAGGDMF